MLSEQIKGFTENYTVGFLSSGGSDSQLGSRPWHPMPSTEAIQQPCSPPDPGTFWFCGQVKARAVDIKEYWVDKLGGDWCLLLF